VIEPTWRARDFAAKTNAVARTRLLTPRSAWSERGFFAKFLLSGLAITY